VRNKGRATVSARRFPEGAQSALAGVIVAMTVADTRTVTRATLPLAPYSASCRMDFASVS
jgi:hypothetical protein